MYKTCVDCGRELQERKPSGKLNFVGDICKDICYSKVMLAKRKAINKVNKQDPFNRHNTERAYHNDTGYDCQRIQDILLHGLHA